VCDAILALSGTTNGAVARKAWEALGRQTGLDLSDIPAHEAHVRHTYADLVERPRRVLASPEWSGLESDDRRYSPFTANVERGIPWRTHTGRQQLYVDHEWMRAAGEALPVYRPPLEPDVDGAVTVRYLTPHNKWSVHSTYGDVETLLTLFRGGQTVWISREEAERLGARDNDWIEVGNRNGVLVARAVVSHRIPAGTAFVYHAQDRHVAVPLAGGGRRAGGHNSPTRIHLKPTHMIGGAAQLSYGFNYYGPIGAQRDERVTLRKLEGVEW
jgi:nitrate reductase alpha subunit